MVKRDFCYAKSEVIVTTLNANATESQKKVLNVEAAS